MYVAEELLRHLLRVVPKLTVKERVYILKTYSDLPRFRHHQLNQIRTLVRAVDEDVQDVDEVDINATLHAFQRFD